MTAPALHTVFYNLSLSFQIFAHASPFSKISEQLIEKVKSSGVGKLTTWSPQQFILNHPVLYPYLYFTCPDSILTIKYFYRQPDGSFPTAVSIVLLNLLGAVSLCNVLHSIITHLGTYLFCRICWPISADQPAAAAHLTENLNVAFELFQVRTWDGHKPLASARNGRAVKGTREAMGIEIRQTIDLCRSEKGKEMRRNAEQLKMKFTQAWEEEGMARQEIRKLLHKYT